MHFPSIFTALILASGVSISFAAPLPAGALMGFAKKLGNGFVGDKGLVAVHQVKGITRIAANLKSLKSVPVVPVAVAKGGIGSAAKVGVAAVAGAAVGGTAVHLATNDSDEVKGALKVKRSPYDFAENEIEDNYEDEMDDTYHNSDDSIADLD